MKTLKNIAIPKSGFEGLKQNWKTDMLSGFMVFLIALPLSLGIAKASGFPASMGVLTAIIGGLLSSFMNVSELSIKGPAAGLITICSGAILEFGGGEQGWKIATAAIVIAAIIQIIFGFLKLGSLSEFFPHSAVHGMLAAIGIVIIAKQIPILLGDEPSLYQGEGPIELILDIPSFIAHAHWHIAIVGALGLLVMFVFPAIKINWLKKVPAPLIVLIVSVPLAIYWHFNYTEPDYSMVSIGDFWGGLGLNVDFGSINQFVFWKYVVMFLFVNSLESLLTVKAIDNLDPYKRTSNHNGDLKSVGVGNIASGLMGGLPMISEVVRSSANIGFGARTKWSNFFHGLFLLLAMIFLIPLIEMVPNAALAGMLIYAGYRLAAPRQFIHTLRLGKEQLAIFLITIIVTLLEDLLIGIAAGILVKFIFHMYRGVKFSNLFISHWTRSERQGYANIKVQDAAIFSNLIGFRKLLSTLDRKSHVVFDLSGATLIDHSFMAFINYFADEFNAGEGSFNIIGLENHRRLSEHELSTCVLMK